MAEIKRYPIVRHLRAEPNNHVLRFRKGKQTASGRGLSFWFLPLETSVVEIPTDDRELPFLFQGRSRDFQEVTVQGAITVRFSDAEKLARRVDFTIDLRTGRNKERPLERLAGIVTESAQQFSWDYLAKTDLEEVLESGFEAVRVRIDEGLRAHSELADMGVDLVAVRIAAVRPSADLEKALQTPTLERLQQQADEATFARRALAVEKERAIEENELQNRIELARREESLINQKGQNRTREAEEEAQAAKIAAEAQSERRAIEAETESNAIATVEQARVQAERDRMEIYREFPAEQMLGLAAQELAGKLGKIEHLSLSPDMLSGLLANLARSGARRLDAG